MVASIIDKSRTTNIELEKLAQQFKINLNGIYTKDMLKNVIPRKGGYIINMQDSDEGSGTHWISVYNDTDTVNNVNRGLRFTHISLYFDSFGIVPPYEIIDFMAKWSKYAIYSEKQIQNVKFGGCGIYCIHFLRCMQFCKGSSRKKYYTFINKYDSE